MFMRNNEPVWEETSGEAIIEMENNDRSDLQVSIVVPLEGFDYSELLRSRLSFSFRL